MNPQLWYGLTKVTYCLSSRFPLEFFHRLLFYSKRFKYLRVNLFSNDIPYVEWMNACVCGAVHRVLIKLIR